VFLLLVCFHGHSDRVSWSPISFRSSLTCLPLSSTPPYYTGHDDAHIPSTSTLSTSVGTDFDQKLSALVDKYKTVVPIKLHQFPQCQVVLCGTFHISNKSIDIVQEVLQTLQPRYVLIELCEDRIDGLLEEDLPELTIWQVCHNSWTDKSLRTLGTGLLTWMQINAARNFKSKLGGELVMAAKEAHRLRSTLVLADRPYVVTIQRVLDRLSLWEKVKVAVVLVFDVISLRWHSSKNQLKDLADDLEVLGQELKDFHRSFPSFAEAVVHERDEFLSQSIVDVCGITALHDSRDGQVHGKTCIVGVVGAGHIAGIQRLLPQGSIDHMRWKKISTSSKHIHPVTQRNVLRIVNTSHFFKTLHN
jgi:pheromone shutdown protein TraB